MSIKKRIERRTGVLWGTFRVGDELLAQSVYVRAGSVEGYVKFEAGWRGRAVYVTWGKR